ncbi:MAG: tetratricopeptide repeat protein [Deltaproteobacteria bacterium]|nr:MAG: tetratricopeptide repeat protein [Deltaproteobacteria bacterium]
MSNHLIRVGAPGAVALAVALCVGCSTPNPPSTESAAKKALAHHDIGVEYMSQGRIALAIRELRAAKEASPEDPWIALALAEAYRRRGKAEEAEAEFLRALERDPELHRARLNLAGMYIQLERYAEAVPHLAQLVDDATFPAPWRALTNLGWAQYRLGHRDEARRNLRIAIEYREDYWPALLNLGILEQEDGSTLEAMRLFERVTEARAYPDAHAEANYRMAEIHVSLGQRRQALERLQAAASTPAQGLWSRRSEEYLQLLR